MKTSEVILCSQRAQFDHALVLLAALLAAFPRGLVSLALEERFAGLLGLVSSFFTARLRVFVPLAAWRIFALVFSDGRLSLDVDGVDWVLVVGAGLLAHAGALTFVFVIFTLGSLTSFLDLGLSFFTWRREGVAVVFLVVVLEVFVVTVAFEPVLDVVVALEVEARALETTFLTPDLMDFEPRSCRLLTREVDPFNTFCLLMLAFVLLFFELDFLSFSALSSFSFERCSFSRGRGPRIPRHLSDPHRHC